VSSSIYPTGTTIYNPEKCYNGYTIFQAKQLGAALIDMNGNVINHWKGLLGFPNKILPGGHVMGSTGARNPKYGYQDYLDLIQVDWDGNIIWKFEKYERVKDPGQKPTWMARQHHDYQREGNPVGYYAPGMNPEVDKGTTLILCHKNLSNSKISDKYLLDDTVIEVTWDGEIIWEWICSDHFDEMDFDEAAKNILSRNPKMMAVGSGMGDWMHINSISTLGPNKWFDAGDKRFAPDNIIWSGRQTNIMGITDKKTGKIVWQVGPDYTATAALRELGQIIGQHHSHMIPRGLPGEGNILVFDNGGRGGYGPPNPGAPTGLLNAIRDYSRVVEFDPVTLEVIWRYPPKDAGFNEALQTSKCYSHLISSAQRLPNGNTLITEGGNRRVFEVTVEHEITWEYVSPYYDRKIPNPMGVYRAYRVPYEWIPQVDKPKETPIPRIDNSNFSVPGSPPRKIYKATKVKSKQKPVFEGQACVLPDLPDKSG
jgi:hypothetical protein